MRSTDTCPSLVIQSILPLKNAMESNMAKIWIWGMPATGDLKRPFKPPAGLFGSMQQQNGPQTDKVRQRTSYLRLLSKKLKRLPPRFAPRTSKVAKRAHRDCIVESIVRADPRNGGGHLLIARARHGCALFPTAARRMPVCVHCGRPVPAIVSTFGSGHVVLARCTHCQCIVDPYLEYGLAVLVVDLILAKPRVYRHILYNVSMHGFMPSREYGPPSLAPSVVPLYIHIRRFVALVLMESYLAWFSLCVHPCAKLNINLWPTNARDMSEYLLSSASFGALRVCFYTLLHMLTLHVALVVGCTAVQWAWRAHSKSSMYWDMYALHLPSVAMLYASLSTVFLLALRVIWASKAPTHAYSTASSTFIPTHIWPSVSAYLPQARRDGMTEWTIRNMMGGMSAGVALAAVLPMKPTAGALVVLLSFGIQSLVRERLQMPWDASSLSKDTLSHFCKAM